MQRKRPDAAITVFLPIEEVRNLFILRTVSLVGVGCNDSNGVICSDAANVPSSPFLTNETGDNSQKKEEKCSKVEQMATYFIEQ
jgi:hypothetical protein